MRESIIIAGLDAAVWAGLASVVAVAGFVAKSVGWIAKLRRRPKLRLKCTAGCRPVDASMYWNRDYPEAKLSMIRLEVANVGGGPAQQVLVKVRCVLASRGGVLQEQREHAALRRLALAWSATDPRNAEAISEPAEISPGDAKQVDLIHVNEALPQELHLDTRPRIPGDPQWLQDQEVRLELVLTSRDSAAMHYEIDVRLVAPWTDADVPAQFVVAGPRRVRRPKDTSGRPG